MLCVCLRTKREFSIIKVSDWFFLTDKECVYCVLRIESLNKIQVNRSFKGLKVFGIGLLL
jgi:hypothetical protein